MKQPLFVGGVVASLLIATSIALAFQKIPRQSKTDLEILGRTQTRQDPDAYAAHLKAMEPINRALSDAEENFKLGNLAKAERLAQETIKITRGLSPLPPELARRLLGKIRMKQGRYQEALSYFQPYWQSKKDSGMDLDMALCFVRLRNYDAARRFYSDNAALRFDSRLTAKDLLGTQTPKTLEASILFAKAQDAAITSSRGQEALDNYIAASKLFPENGMFAYYTGKALTNLNRNADAVPYFRKATRRLDSKSRLLEDAKESEQRAVYFKSIGH